MLEEFELSNMSTKGAVSMLEERLNEPSSLVSAGVNYDGIFLSNGKRQVVLKDELFYLSIAPYINQTHPCLGHNLVTCRGELVDQSFDVVVVDLKGNTVFNQPVSTHHNGFLGIWLPKDMKGTITIKQGNKQASGIIETMKDSPTCNTTLKLSD